MCEQGADQSAFTKFTFFSSCLYALMREISILFFLKIILKFMSHYQHAYFPGAFNLSS